MVISKKFTIDYVRQKFEEKNCILLGTDYENSLEKLDYICNKGHKTSVSFSNFRQNYLCGICGVKRGSKKRRKNFSEVKKNFERENYKLLVEEVEYKNNKHITLYML